MRYIARMMVKPQHSWGRILLSRYAGGAAYLFRISGSHGGNSAFNKQCISKKVHFGRMDPRIRVQVIEQAAREAR